MVSSQYGINCQVLRAMLQNSRQLTQGSQVQYSLNTSLVLGDTLASTSRQSIRRILYRRLWVD